MAKAFDVDTGGTLQTNLVAWYNLESDGTDEFSTNNLTNNNAVGFSSGKIGNAADTGATNTNEYLSVTSALSYNGGAYSLSTFINPTALPASGNLAVPISVGEAGTDTNLAIWLFNDGGTQKIEWVRTKRGVADQKVSETTTLSTGTWYHVVLTYDGSTLEGFRDNVSKGTVGATGAGSNGNIDLATLFSWSQSAPTHMFAGLVDLAGFWNKQLQSQEITDLYNSGNGNAYRTQATTASPASILMMGV